MTSMKMNKFSMLDLECSVFILELCLVLGAGYNETKVDMPNSPITTFSPPEGNTTFIDGTTWCVASPAANQLDMQQALDWACGPGLADCSGIQPGQPCYQPNNLLAVASYAFNMYYQTNGNSPIACNFGGTGMITSSDPSYGSCQFLTSGNPNSNSFPTSSRSPGISGWLVPGVLFIAHVLNIMEWRVTSPQPFHL